MPLSTMHPTTLSIRRRLDAAVDGRVITPGDAVYDQARAVYGGFDRHPRGGGHSLAGHGSAEGGVVLDLRELRGLDIDTGHRIAWAGTGLTARHLHHGGGRPRAGHRVR